MVEDTNAAEFVIKKVVDSIVKNPDGVDTIEKVRSESLANVLE